ncbi:NAD(P)H-hydrate dehydratase [Cellulomonas hominis]|uniref:ADP-dependent (S)-NAD(P)H-hydrate dehydratase n=1 Tax=Cellulomonas hominis TaxID=156981 RepID=A0A7Z8NSV7_9CELL|nr:NAD(P)H-hydrate dehydratase [Cellulomonas hominis]TKR26897.1 NAD(P)H-hydrate dehydratase [Cellulomonas hominis]
MTDAAPLTPALLRGWPLPPRDGAKDVRGGVLVVGGARRTPGAAALAGLTALRIGAGRLTLAVAASVAAPLAVATPEAGVLALPEDADGSPTGATTPHLAAELERADAVVVGPGLDEPEGAAALVRSVLGALADREAAVLLDAFALGVLPGLRDEVTLPEGRTVLTPNTTEAARLLGVDEVDPDDAAARVADRWGAVVSCAGTIAHPDGRRWSSATGYAGLGTSGSGDVLAGAVAGLLAGGAPAEQAACWGTAVHGSAGDRLAARVGPLGYLARELADEVPAVLVELQA